MRLHLRTNAHRPKLARAGAGLLPGAAALLLSSVAPALSQVPAAQIEDHPSIKADGAVADDAARDRRQGEAPAIDAARIVDLKTWQTSEALQSAVSAEAMIENLDVVGASGEEIGTLEDIVVGTDGRALAVVAEIGGVWDIGDTHVSVPFDEVSVDVATDRIALPVTEETIDDYGATTIDWFADASEVSARDAAREVTSGMDDRDLGPRAWRVSELVGDYARVLGASQQETYGYVEDVLFKNGAVAAVVVAADRTPTPRGRFAAPFFGAEDASDWRPGSPYYDMPYTMDDVDDAVAYDPDGW